MAHAEDQEKELEGRQDAALHPIGRALRSTYDAENHDTLGRDLTGLMLELARVEPPAAPRRSPAPAASAAPSQQASFLRRLFSKRPL